MSSKAPKRAIPTETAGTEAALGPDKPPSDKSVTLAPINRLPFDIFQIIVTMVQDEAKKPFPFTVSHVCCLWREHVLAMHLLWSSLHIHERVPRWEMLEAMLQRSGQAPLDIYINKHPFTLSALPQMRKIMQMIRPHLARWRTLHLTDVPYKVRRVLLDQIRAKPAPLLEKINVIDRNPYLRKPSPNWRAQNIFVGFHNLTSVTWTSDTPNLRKLPAFKNLKNLTIGNGTLRGVSPLLFIQLIHRTLSDSPSLETFQIYHHSRGRSSQGREKEAINAELPIITHYSLRTLIIESSLEVRSALVRTLILPKLRALSDRCDNPVDLSCCNIITQDNNLPELRVIVICGDILTPLHGPTDRTPSLGAHMPFLGPAIRNLANLRVLIFAGINFEGSKWLPDLCNCCPHLRWLLFIHCTGCSIPSIKSLVETRTHTEGINPLELLYIVQRVDEPLESTLTMGDIEWFSKFLTFEDVYNWLENSGAHHF